MERATYNPRPAKTAEGLPELAYGVLREDRSVIILKRGVRGYYSTDYRKEAADFVDEFNARMDVTKAQRAAMEAGSCFGWDCPAADPATYDAEGVPKRDRD